MADDKIITLRFKQENVLDMKLYRELECEKNCLGLSMPTYVKGVLQEHFKNKASEKPEEDIIWMLKDELDQYLHQGQGVVREELMSLSSVLLATLVRMNGVKTDDILINSDLTAKESTEEDSKDNLPEYSDELPEGFDDVLGKLM
ncbi:MAG: hypothetical protein ACI4FX_00390 [Agathobacter sp.]